MIFLRMDVLFWRPIITASTRERNQLAKSCHLIDDLDFRNQITLSNKRWTWTENVNNGDKKIEINQTNIGSKST